MDVCAQTASQVLILEVVQVQDEELKNVHTFTKS